MAVFKCKMCGGTIEFEQGATVGVCDSCGTKQTLPRLDDDRRANLYDRANHFRRNNEFDKAAGIYEQILTEDTADAEAYWSLVLCRYGIEYVEDPVTRKRVPTVNRAQFTSIFDDDNYKSALQYADGFQRELYEDEAKAINEIQKGILAISQREEPFDVFICYKETDANGRRTPDSVLANDLYHQLTQEGFKVFFSRITLEDKLGTAYEPYIFAALNSAKVMVVLGTKPEHFNAVWVKNEWSRYLALVKQSGGKKILIPAYKDMDPYDLPEEFSHLQAQDMGKLGFMQDLIRGIKKITQADEPKAAVKETVVVGAVNANTAPLLKRAFMFLEDGNWEEADAYCERVLDQDPENAQAYLGKLMAELRVRRQEELPNCGKPFDGSNNYQKVIRFSDASLSSALRGYIDHINERNENARLTNIYNGAVAAMRSAGTEKAFKAAADTFKTIPGFKDADALAEQCLEKAEICRKDDIYASAKALMTGERSEIYESAIEVFQRIPGWKDADEQIEACQRIIEEIKAREEAERLERERQAEEQRLREEAERLERERQAEDKRLREEAERRERERQAEERSIAAEKAAKKRKKIRAIAIAAVVTCAAFVVVLTKVIIPYGKYMAAVNLYNAGKNEEAITAFDSLNGFKDSEIKLTEIRRSSGWIKSAPVGEIICFGAYEQDNDTSNGKEDIEWLVLAKEDNKALVISRYALDCKQYNSENTAITWETCSLRKWLNGEFLNAAFTSEEQNRILGAAVTADHNPSYDTSPGNNTTDKVFLLSIADVNKYFSSKEARRCAPTDYAKAQGAYTGSSNSALCWWWLRSPGYFSNYAAYVYIGGSVYYGGSNVDNSGNAVRPALWINLEP